MSIETWLAYLVACIVLTVIPGPSVMLFAAQALTCGREAALICVAGNVIGSHRARPAVFLDMRFWRCFVKA